MTEVIENCVVPEIFADEIAQVHVTAGVMRWCYWAWQMGPNGILQRTVVIRMAMPMDGVRASRPIITAGLERAGHRVSHHLDMTTAH